MHKQLHVTHEVILITTDNITTAYLPGQNSNPTLLQTTWHSQRETNRYTKWNNVIKSTSVCADIPGSTVTKYVFTFLWTYNYLTYNYCQVHFHVKENRFFKVPMQGETPHCSYRHYTLLPNNQCGDYTLDLYSGDTRFKLNPDHRPTWLMFFVVFAYLANRC